MSNPAPLLLDEPIGTPQFRPLTPERLVITSQASAHRLRGIRMSKAVNLAQKLWVSRPTAFALSGLVMPEPAAEPVATVDLLQGLNAVLARHLHLGGHERHAVALWIAHTWTIEWAPRSPRLILTGGPAPSGKSTLLRLLAALVPRPLAIVPASAPRLVALIDKVHPTLLLDDADTWLAANKALRRVLAVGHGQDTVVQNPAVHAFESPILSPFTPCALSMNGAPPPEIAKRGIAIGLKPALAHERTEPLPTDEPFAVLRARAARWSRDCGQAVQAAAPLPAGLSGSHAENWRPLLAIAQDADAAWVQEASTAALALSKAQASDDLSIDLLADIRAAFADAGRMTSDDLITALTADAERPWRRLRGRAIDPRALAQLLRPFGIRPRVIRTGDDGFARGYLAADFAEPFARYLPPPEAGPACVHT